MIAYDQIAVRTPDLEAQIELMEELGLLSWVRDKVEATHIYLDSILEKAGMERTFTVKLGFNYEHIPGVEFELIEIVQGQSVQLMRNGIMSHFGYHVADPAPGTLNTLGDTLLVELKRLVKMGLVVSQISQTTRHQNTRRRYRYAFVQSNKNGGIPIKIIQRIGDVKHEDNGESLATGIKAYEWLHLE